MAEGIRWRKAILISLVLHGVVLTGVGWMVAKTFVMQPTPEQYMELELTNEPDCLARIADNGGSGSMAVNDSQAVTAMAAPIAHVPVVSREPAPSVLSSEICSNVSGPGISLGQEGDGTVAVGAGTNKGTDTHPGSGTGKSGKGGGIISPGILSRVEPLYPEQARQAGLEGTVVLKIQILENGRSGHINVYRSSGSDLLDNAAVAAVQQWRFTPAKERESGQAVVCYTAMPVAFRLKS